MNLGFRSKREKESKEKREEERVNGTKKMRRTEGEMQSFSVGKHGIHTARTAARGTAARGTAALEGRATTVRRGSTALHPP